MKRINIVRHQVIYKDPFAYCAHPHIVDGRDQSWCVVFNRTMRRSYILHPPNDPHYYNLIMRSNNQGESWSVPQVAPGYDWYGVECAGLTSLSNGVILLNQWRFKWFPLGYAERMAEKSTYTLPADWVREMITDGEINRGTAFPTNVEDYFPWARANGGTFVHRSSDYGVSWKDTIEIGTAPYSGGYGMRGAVELSHGELILPLSDVPNYQTVFIVRSKDYGLTWEEPIKVASQTGLFFEEPSALLLPDGRILMMLRENKTHWLYQTESLDGGYTWSEPIQTPIWGYPAHLLLLPDQRVLCVYGYRKQPYGIRAVLSNDFGHTWDVDNVLIIREDFPNRDLGYPSSVLKENGHVYTVYYGQDTDGVTCIQASEFEI